MSWCPFTCDVGEEGEVMEECSQFLCQERFIIALEESLCKLKCICIIAYNMDLLWEGVSREGDEILEEVE